MDFNPIQRRINVSRQAGRLAAVHLKKSQHAEEEKENVYLVSSWKNGTSKIRQNVKQKLSVNDAKSRKGKRTKVKRKQNQCPREKDKQTVYFLFFWDWLHQTRPDQTGSGICRGCVAWWVNVSINQSINQSWVEIMTRVYRSFDQSGHHRYFLIAGVGRRRWGISWIMQFFSFFGSFERFTSR